MKKFLTIAIILSFILICENVGATVVTQRKIRTQQEQIPQKQTQTKEKTFANNIKNCRPYNEKMDYEYMGMSINYNIRIDGWQNGKCILNFEANTQGIGESFENIYGISASEASIYSYTPKIQCAFTRDQLEYVGDTILQEEERNNGSKNNMLKNPNNINLEVTSANDAKLLDVIFNQNACKIQNAPIDLNRMLEQLF